MTRLSVEEWKNIFNNLDQEGEEIEIAWLDDTKEYCLCNKCDLFEDGFKTEKECYDRLTHLRNVINY